MQSRCFNIRYIPQVLFCTRTTNMKCYSTVTDAKVPVVSKYYVNTLKKHAHPQVATRKYYQYTKRLRDVIATNNMEEAQQIFDDRGSIKLNRDIINSMIEGYLTNNGDLARIVGLFDLAKQNNVTISRLVTNCALDACVQVDRLDYALQIFANAEKNDHAYMRFTKSLIARGHFTEAKNLLSKYYVSISKSWRVNIAREIDNFEKNEPSDETTITVNKKVASLCEEKAPQVKQALLEIRQAYANGAVLEASTFTPVLRFYCDRSQDNNLELLIDDMKNTYNIEPSRYHQSMILACLSRASIERGRKYFDTLAVKDYVLYHVMISAYVQATKTVEDAHHMLAAREVFYAMMIMDELEPTETLLYRMINGFGRVLDLERALNVYGIAKNYNYDTLNVQKAVLRAHLITDSKDAPEFFDSMIKKDIQTYDIMIVWYMKHNMSEEAAKLSEYKMKLQSSRSKKDTPTAETTA